MALVDLVNVFTHLGRGGNPCPIVTNASNMSDLEMQQVAQKYGHESGFVCMPNEEGIDYTIRFWVPRHEMEMCGHASIGALWLLARKGEVKSNRVQIQTLSGSVTGYVNRDGPGDASIEISQPEGKVVELTPTEESDVLKTLRLSRSDLLDLPIQNASTSRVKTIIPVKSVERLNSLTSDMSSIESCCERINSTGLYPYAVEDQHAQYFEARQFPKSSGYPEDAATGIAASALTFGLLKNGLIKADSRSVRILQGRSMGKLSEIRVRFDLAEGRTVGCILGGSVTLADWP
jgi:PhzF family phenazine biosynthesis protein